MTLTKRSILLIAGGALLTTSVVACHGVHSATAEEKSEWVVGKVTRELELNERQQATLGRLKDEVLMTRTAMKRNKQGNLDDIQSMLAQPNFDRDKANTMINLQIETANNQAPRIVDAVGDFWESLNDEQRAELREFIGDKIERHRDGRWM